MSTEIYKKLDLVYKISNASKISKLRIIGFRYIYALFFRTFIYKFLKTPLLAEALTFFNYKMYINLPSATDIFLTHGKSHDSEIRLARFMLINLKKGDTFIDVGSHYGYFTLLAHYLVKENGTIHAFEASKKTFSVLEKNTQKFDNIFIQNKAVGKEEGSIVFHQFSNMYSEYNSVDVDQYKNENWYDDNLVEKSIIDNVSLDKYISVHNLRPKMIKIDVEGAEEEVLEGMKATLEQQSIYIAMEFLNTERGNQPHRKANDILRSLGYNSYFIKKDGLLKSIDNIPEYLNLNNLESDNIIYSK